MGSIRKRGVAAALVAGTLALTGCITPESSFPSKTNDARKAVGLGPLSTDPPGGADIYNRARMWAAKMCQDRVVSHSALSAYYQPAGNWRALGENVGRVGWNQNDTNSQDASTNSLWSTFMNSSSHRTNILGNWTHQVVAEWPCQDGMLYVTHVFLRY